MLCAQQKSQIVTLKGTLVHFSNEAMVEDLSEMQYLNLPTRDRMIITDSSGNFSLSFSLNAANYFRLGRNILYLTPGDSMIVTIDKNSPQKSSFKGIGAAANLYLKGTPFPKAGSFLESGSNIKKSIKQTIDTILMLAEGRTRELSELTGVSEEFRRLENARIRADVINSFENISGYGPYMLDLKGEDMKKYQDSVRLLCTPLVERYGQNFIDSSLLKIQVYRDVSDVLLKTADVSNNANDANYIRDWQQSSALVNRMVKQDDKSILSGFKKEVMNITDAKFRQAAQDRLNALMAFGKGDLAVDFTAVDMQGQTVKLSSLKGKVIYVDLWATWCGPCLKEMPFFEQLKNKYKGNANVAFVSLSIDDNEDGWRQNVELRRANGLQWIINRDKLDAYNIVGIPRVLLIDKSFRIAEMNAPSPSEKQASEAIDKLLKL